MSGNEVVLVGDTMAAVVAAVTAVEDLTGSGPIVVGGLAVLARLSSAHRATIDLDIVDRRSDGRERQLEVLRESDRTKPAEPVGVYVPTKYGDVRVDVLEVSQHELENPSDDVGDRRHAGSHAWAADTASPMSIVVLGSDRQELAKVSSKVAQPGPLIAMKLQAIMDRDSSKAGTDLWDIMRLVLDPVCRPDILQQLSSCDLQMAADIAEHVEYWFGKQRNQSLDRLGSVARASVTSEDVDLVAELLADACSQRA